MLAALLTAAQAEKLITVRDVQAMLADAGCPEHSRGHAHDLMTGGRQPTPQEFAAVVTHLGCEVLAYAAARAVGGSFAPVSKSKVEPMASAIDPPPPRLQWPPPDSCKIADGDHWWATDGVVAVRDDGTPPMFQCGRTSWREGVSLEAVRAVIANGLDDYRVPYEPPRFDAGVADVLRCGTSIDVTVPRVAVVRRGGDVVAVVAQRVTGSWDDGVDEVEVVDGMVREVVQ